MPGYDFWHLPLCKENLVLISKLEIRKSSTWLIDWWDYRSKTSDSKERDWARQWSNNAWKGSAMDFMWITRLYQDRHIYVSLWSPRLAQRDETQWTARPSCMPSDNREAQQRLTLCEFQMVRVSIWWWRILPSEWRTARLRHRLFNERFQWNHQTIKLCSTNLDPCYYSVVNFTFVENALMW